MTIRNDASRPEARLGNKRRARSVITRQGQVLLDIDVTTAGLIAADRTEIEALDTLGPTAAPLAEGGFQIGVNGTISAGRIYLDGLLVENPDAACTLATQPHPADPLPAGPAIVGLKALVRYIDPVEDRRLTDAALGDAATAGRGLVDWRVFALSLSSGGAPTCGVASSDWDNLAAASSGQLSARVDPGSGAPNFCSPAATGGYSGLDNVLYRIEVDGGQAVAGFPTLDGPRFGLNGLRLKLSRNNASLIARITNYNGRQLTVDPPALDASQWFAAGGVAEIVSVHDDLDATAASSQVRLFTVAQAADDQVTLAGTDPLPLPPAASLGTGWYLRLWDTFPNFAPSATAVAPGAGPSVEIDCGSGVLITVWPAQSGTTIFRRGDWWSFIARADGTIDWPQSGSAPVARRPDGPRIHYGRLAVTASATAVPTDCRPIFAPLTEQFTLLYAGGDGQEASLLDSQGAFVPLRAKARVAVACGGLPSVNQSVLWSFPVGLPAGQINGAAGPVVVQTDANGLAEVTWALDRSQPDSAHGLLAALVVSPSTPVTPVRFTASFETASRTSYTPGCDLLKSATNVQDALTLLCNAIPKRPDTLKLTRIVLMPVAAPNIAALQTGPRAAALEPRALGDRAVAGPPLQQIQSPAQTIINPPIFVPPTVPPVVVAPPPPPPPPPPPQPTELINSDGMIRNGLEVGPDQLKGGIHFQVDRGDLAAQVQPFDPIVDLTLHLPYPVSEPDIAFWGKTGVFGTLPVHLTGSVTMKGVEIIFTLSDQAIQLLGSPGFLRFGVNGNTRFLASLRLRSQWIWINSDAGRVYLNAATLGQTGPDTHRELAFDPTDPRRAADLDMFFYVAPPFIPG